MTVGRGTLLLSAATILTVGFIGLCFVVAGPESETPAVSAKLQRIMDHQKPVSLPVPPPVVSALPDSVPQTASEQVALVRPAISPNPASVSVVKAGFVRSGPGVKYPIVRTAKVGETLSVIERDPWWIRVEDGWIYRDFVRANAPD